MSILNNLNRPQREAVKHTEGPLLIIAGPGSGKTHTVACSIAYAIEENGVIPDKILAFSFTRKAREELRHRVQEVMERGENATDVWISTFHSFCGKILHQDAQQLDIGNRQEFTVNELTHFYNEGARAQIEYLQHHQFAEPEDALRFINECRAANVSPAEAGSYAQHRHMSQVYVEIYQRYIQLAANDEANYTEYQLLTNALLRDVPEVRERWQEKFDLIFVDEYQDTDPIQYQIIKTLAGRHQNLRVVGDDDQGIYGFRGADIQNILNFEEDYPNADVISLGQNYRSTQRIVEASRALAEFNPVRRDKELFTRNPEGEKVRHLHCEDNEKEAATIAEFISHAIQEGRNPSDFAVLYRINRQAEAFTEAFNELEIPCHVVGNSSNGYTDGVSLMTIHKSKGLEFPNVFVAGVCTSLLPFHNSNEQDWGEELRLLYVAMTRAKHWLCLSSYEEDAQYPRGKSQFLDYIPATLVESIETLENIPIPPRPDEMMPIITEEPSDYVEPLPEQLLGDGMTVIGVDPGNIGTRNTNVGWSVTQKTSDGYSVLNFDTERPTGTPENKLRHIEQKIKALIQSPSNRPHAIAVEKLEVATEEARREWFLYVAVCVATVRNIADTEGIECRLYTPQHVKYAATDNRNASKRDVQKAVKRMCNLPQIPEPHHSADAIATSLCYLRSYLNSTRFEGNKRKKENLNKGCAYLDKRQYKVAVSEFKEAINIDPIYTDAYSGMGRVHLAQSNVDAAENAAKKALKLADNNHPDSQKLLDAIRHYRSGCNSLNNHEWNIAIDKFQESVNIEPIFTDAHCGLGRTHLAQGNLDEAENKAKEAIRLTKNSHPDSQKLLDAIAHYRSGCNSLNNREWGMAIGKFQEAINIELIFTDAHCGLSKAYLEIDNLEDAKNAAEEALSIINDYSPALEILESIKQKYYEHGMSYLNQDNLVLAEKAVNDALRLDVNNQPPRELLHALKEAYCNRGHNHLNNQQYGNAIAAFEKTINIFPIFIKAHCFKKAHYGLGRAYLGQDKLAEAEKSAKEALRTDANYQPALKLLDAIKQVYYNRGCCYLNSKQYNEAAGEFKIVADMDPNYMNVQNNLGFAYYWMQDFYSAINSYTTATEIDSNDIKAYIMLGLCYISNGKYDCAVSKFRKAIQIDPHCRVAHLGLGCAYYKLRKFEDAKQATMKVLRIDPTYQRAHNLLRDIEKQN